jgi:hypothetical protein
LDLISGRLEISSEMMPLTVLDRIEAAMDGTAGPDEVGVLAPLTRAGGLRAGFEQEETSPTLKRIGRLHISNGRIDPHLQRMGDSADYFGFVFSGRQ